MDILALGQVLSLIVIFFFFGGGFGLQVVLR